MQWRSETLPTFSSQIATPFLRKDWLGLFISIDGIDGTGKSTQIKLLADWFVQQGREVCCLRDPGATQLGKKLRAILLGEEGIDFSLVPEMLLYMASRAQMVTERIKPALEAGQIVLTDRYLLSNVAYQGVRAGVDRDQIWTVGQIATQGIVPDLTLLMDLPVVQAFERIRGGLDRLESRGPTYMEEVRQNFLEESQKLGDRVQIVDASREPQLIHQEIRSALAARGLAN